MIVNGFPESQPKIEHSQAGREAPHKSARNDGSQLGKVEQQGIIGPFWSPGQNQQKHAKGGAQSDKQQRTNSQQPDIRWPSPRGFGRHPVANVENALSLRGMFFRTGYGRNCLRIGGHAAPHEYRRRTQPGEWKPISVFYGLRALIRSATSR